MLLTPEDVPLTPRIVLVPVRPPKRVPSVSVWNVENSRNPAKSACGAALPETGQPEVRGSGGIGRLQRLGVVPGQPAAGLLDHLLSVLLQDHEILEGVDPVELAGVDQAHIDVADPGTVERLVRHRILPVQNGHFKALLSIIFSPRR